ncbi:MAG TPA: UPF0158 family protein [Nitrolancea sp.]|nr:UPF0158 family protein [Nitrolancea sp.]
MDDRQGHQAIRRLRINLNELDVAFDSTGPEMWWYLDLETGDVPLVTSESRSAMQQIVEEFEPDDDEASFRAALEQSDLPAWRREMALEAYLIEAGFGRRYLAVPEADTRADYRDMEDFIESVADEQLRQQLERAIDGPGAFRRFRNEISELDDERTRWFAFRDARRRERILRWLADEGIQPILEEC